MSTRAFFAAVRRAQHANLCAIDASAGIPHAAASGHSSDTQTLNRDDAKEPAAPQARGINGR